VTRDLAAGLGGDVRGYPPLEFAQICRLGAGSGIIARAVLDDGGRDGNGGLQVERGQAYGCCSDSWWCSWINHGDVRGGGARAAGGASPIRHVEAEGTTKNGRVFAIVAERSSDEVAAGRVAVDCYASDVSDVIGVDAVQTVIGGDVDVDVREAGRAFEERAEVEVRGVGARGLEGALDEYVPT